MLNNSLFEALEKKVPKLFIFIFIKFNNVDNQRLLVKTKEKENQYFCCICDFCVGLAPNIDWSTIILAKYFVHAIATSGNKL